MTTESERAGRRLNQVRVSDDSRAMARRTPVGNIEKLERELIAEQGHRIDIQAKLSAYSRTKFHEAQMEIRNRIGNRDYIDRDRSYREWHKKRSEMMAGKEALKVQLASSEKMVLAIKGRLAVVRNTEPQESLLTVAKEILAVLKAKL